MAHKAAVRISHIFVEGDDCIISYGGQIDVHLMRYYFKSLGFEAKEPEYGFGPGAVSYCSTKFDPVLLEPLRDPRNILDNIGVSFSPIA